MTSSEPRKNGLKNRKENDDTNVLYKVENFHEEKLGNATHKKDLFLYWREKFLELIPSYQPLFGMILHHKTQHENEDDMEEFMHAIAERFEQVLFAYDIINRILSTGRADPWVEFVLNFHLSHFISLVKTLGDNLAWMLTLYLKFQLDDRDIDLLRKHFKNKLKGTSPRMVSLIHDDPKFNKFESLNEYRIILQHKQKIHMHKKLASTRQEAAGFVIPVNREALVRGKNICRRKGMLPKVLWDMTMNARHNRRIRFRKLEVSSDELEGIDLLEFCNEHLGIISTMYKKVFSRIIIELLKKENTGEVTKYYEQQQVAILKLSGEVKNGDKILIEGLTTPFIQKVTSMEINHAKVVSARDCEIGIKLDKKAKKKDKVFKFITPVPDGVTL
jgi:hypothetical protein